MRDRDDYLSTGIGFLKTLLGTYIIIIAGICYMGYKDSTVEEDPVAIEQEAQDSYTILSFNGKAFAVETKEYEAFRKSNINTTVLIDALDQSPTQSVINKDDVQVLATVNSFDQAAKYINNLEKTGVSLRN